MMANYIKSFMQSPKRLAEAVKNEGRKITGHPGTLEVYTLPLKAHTMNVDGCKGFMFGEDSHKKNRTIMVLGATGAGKSTLVNGMINYILGVTWEDTFRFKLVDEDTSKSQAHSQTSEVTVYKLNHREGFQIDYSLTIVDTPGFGDTRGIERDRVIISQLEKLFKAKLGVREIDAICFVAQASLARLTTTQTYVFDSVLSIFGKDVEENIRILVTFSDGTKPAVLEAMKEARLPCPKDQGGLPIHFKFNNPDEEVPGANNEDGDNDDDEDQGGGVHKMYWNNGTTNMGKFFSALKKINTKSLTLTKEVLRQRGQLENSIGNLERKVKLGLAKLEQIEKEILHTKKKKITANKAFEYEVSVTKPVKVKANGSSLNCKCVECDGKCTPLEHVLEDFYWDSETVKEKRTYKELQGKYEKASKKAMSVEDIIKQMRLEDDRLQEEVVRLMERSAECINTLKEIDLKPNPLSTPDYIDLLIEGEKSEAKSGYLQRIKKLEDLKKIDITTGKVARGESLV